MTIKVTRWSPDTCKCVIDYSWDDTDLQESRIHKLSNIISICPEHIGLGDISNYNACVKENTGKNIALGLIKDIAPDAVWSFGARLPDGSRVIQISGIDAAKKIQASAILNSKFDIGHTRIL